MSIVTNLLTDESFHSTIVDPKSDPPDDAECKPCEIWQYIKAIPEVDLEGFSIADNDVEMVRRTGNQAYDHVLIPTEAKNVYLVIVVDLLRSGVFGHYLLDLNQKYGLETPGGG